MPIHELTPRELYDKFTTEDDDPADLAAMGRISLVTRLINDENLNEDDALFAADGILEHAHRIEEETR